MFASALPPDLRRRLCPAGTSLICIGLCPLVRALPFGSIWARGRTKGIAQELKQPLTAGQSHGLTSGGEADAKLAHDFKGEANAKLAMTFKGKAGAEVAHDS